jgi:GDP-L-fucose synthase
MEKIMDISKTDILVTGGAGFLGRVVVDKLVERRAKSVVVVRSNDFNLTSEADVIRLFNTHKPQAIIHMAAVVGGIGINKIKPGTFFYDNLIMGVLLQEHARRNNVEKFISIGTICAYPKYSPVPFMEDDIWNGYPEETNAPYGLAKKMLLVQAQAYRKEFGFNGIYLLPVNLYGPGDNFNENTSHVIPALIKKIVNAKKRKERYITVWGTGSATREFLYVDDAAEGIILACEKYESELPLNLGNGVEVKISDLTARICELCKYDGDIVYDSSKPDGQPRRCLDTTRAREEIGFTAKTSLTDGLLNTIRWYEATND